MGRFACPAVSTVSMVMPLSEIRRVYRTVDDDSCSAFADPLAIPWGVEPGACRFWRSSANHVFAVRDDRFPGGAGYLRAVPAWWRDRFRVEAVAGLVAGLTRCGLPVAAITPSLGGDLIETVATELGDYHVMVVAGAAGQQLDVGDLTEDRVHRWGAALARVHRDAGAHSALPRAFERLACADALLRDDHQLEMAAGRVTELLARLPAGPDRFGVIHGDFELDNLAWEADAVTMFDFDEAAQSWYADDIARATRDLDSLPMPRRQQLLTAFVTGYRSIRPLDDHDLQCRPLFTAAHAAESLLGLREVIDDGFADTDPQWLTTLRAKISVHYERQRGIVLDFALA
jgi:Ser/Thr protein kinase RdoA (MazF antagonist)